MKHSFMFASSLLLCVTFYAILTASQPQAVERPRQNNAQSLLQLAENYYFGLGGVEKNTYQARVYFHALTEQNENAWAKAIAQARMAEIYYYGIGVDVNYSHVQYYAELAAQQNVCPFAQNLAKALLGEIASTYMGEFLLLDYAKSCQYFTDVSKVDGEWQAHAQAKLADIYYEGCCHVSVLNWDVLNIGKSKKISVEIDFFQSRHYAELAAQQNRDLWAKAQAQARLADIYYRGGNGIAVDFSLSLHYAVLAAQQNYNLGAKARGQARLADIYYQGGNGVAVNFFESARYAQLAAKQEDSLWLSIKLKAD